MVKWTKIKSRKGSMWNTTYYETNNRKAKYIYKIVSVPTAACKKEWKKIGDIAKKTTKYSNTKP